MNAWEITAAAIAGATVYLTVSVKAAVILGRALRRADKAEGIR